MNKASLLALLPVLAATACAESQQALDRDEAVDRVVEELVDDSHPLIMFASDAPLPAGSRITSASPDPAADDNPAPVVLDEPAWLVWIDDEPGALFSHANRVVLVTADDGELTVMDANWWPAVDDVRVFTDDSYLDADAWVYSTGVAEDGFRGGDGVVVPSATAPDCEEGASRGKALVINGWQARETAEGDFAANATQMTTLLEGVGLDTTHLAPDGTADADGFASAETIAPYFRQLEKDLKPGDDFVLYVTGHGHESDGNYKKGQTQIGAFWEENLEFWLKRLDPGVNVIVIVDGCHSGGMADGLSCVADLVVTSTDRRTAWADLDERFLSGITDINNDDVGTEWTSSFVAGWNEVLGMPATLDGVEMSAQSSGTSFVEKLTESAFEHAHKYDAAEQGGRTTPTFTRGAAKTRPGGVSYHTEGLACAPTDPSDPPGCTLPANGVAEAVGSMLALAPDDPALAELLCGNTTALPTGNPVLYSDGVKTGTASGAVDIDGFGGVRSIELRGAAELGCGSAANRLVLCDPAAPPASGEFLLAWFTVDAPLQLENNEMFTQLGFVLDSNGDPADNYVPPPEWSGDFWAGADLAVEIAHNPSYGWGVSVLDMANGFVAVDAGVRVVMQGNAVVIAMPMNLLPADNPGARVSAFEHTGDWGQTMPWSGDVYPLVGEPLFTFPAP